MICRDKIKYDKVWLTDVSVFDEMVKKDDSMKKVALSCGMRVNVSDSNREIHDLDGINTDSPEGKLLFAALAKLTTESQTDKTPEEVIAQLNALSDEIERNK